MNRQKIFPFMGALLSIIITVILGEIITRLMEKAYPDFGKLVFVNSDREILAFDERLGWRNVPNLQFLTNGMPGSTNSQGFRSPDYPIERSGHKKRVLILGDSFAWGPGVGNDNLFSRITEKAVRAANIDLEIINTAVTGWGTDQEYLYFVTEGFQYRPDVVILALFLLNDPADNCNSRRYGMEKPYFDIDHDGITLRNVPVPLYHAVLGKIELSSVVKISRFMRFMLFAVWSHNRLLKVAHYMGLISIDTQTAKVEHQIGKLCLLPTVSIITQLSKFCKGSGCSLIVMKFGRFLSNINPTFSYMDKRDTDFRKLYDQHLSDVDYLDIDAEFDKRRISTEELLIGDGLHWNETGHFIVGDSLARFLLVKFGGVIKVP